MPSGTLFVVATPLGNLSDITPRALDTLKRAAIVACEDTRRTRGLLSHFGIRAPRVISCHKFNEKRQLDTVLAALREGKDVALVSDGGTPGLSDPGAVAVEAALNEGLPVSPIPGPSAVAAALSVCGFEGSSFVFAGFLPSRAGERRRAIEALRGETRVIVLFEAPHRVAATVAGLAETLGDRPVTLLREITKMHEEVRRTSLVELSEALRASPPRGEFTLVVAGRPEGAEIGAVAEKMTGDQLRRRYGELLDAGIDRREALKSLVREAGLSRKVVYDAVRTGDRLAPED
ncbi:MAG TPA: 16S rRNA (cytidine(1402)-2'-O)-methyltransferase [Patescibacteria group bacterium]|jgi:16S rRNA (cytidine1402-2'-O)-methyltransferase|nr:16S rRNA (cytidine(1402)-2'-O)-methyltransferase [Patescibacteria group bacterium]